MKLTNEFKPIRQWANEKGIYERGDIKTQTLKLSEEVGELSKGVIEKDQEGIKDALGDCAIVLVSAAELAGFKLEDCINAAYDVIKNRTGKMDNGTFVKDGTDA